MQPRHQLNVHPGPEQHVDQAPESGVETTSMPVRHVHARCVRTFHFVMESSIPVTYLGTDFSPFA